MELCWLAGPGSCLPWTILHYWKDQEHYLASPGHTGSPPTTTDWWRMRHILDIGVFHHRKGSGDEVANKPSKSFVNVSPVCLRHMESSLTWNSACSSVVHRWWQPMSSCSVQFSCSVVSSSATPCTAARQASLSVTNSQSTQTHVHCVSDAIQLSHPLSSPSPPAFNLSQHQGLFQWVSSSHQVAKILVFQLRQSFQWILRIDLP